MVKKRFSHPRPPYLLQTYIMNIYEQKVSYDYINLYSKGYLEIVATEGKLA